MPLFPRFHHREFADVAALVANKGDHRISVCIPTLNEARTIGPIVATILHHLCRLHPLIDEVIVIDSGSSDDTLAIASAAGAIALESASIAPETGSYKGKGENLWKALHAATGDILCYIDGDISNFHTGFVTGLVGPLLRDPSLGYVKAYYERPLDLGDAARSGAGGRVSEILIRPLISLFYPELTGVLQPLAGEYAARRSLLESLHFPTGYGVEIAHLIDLSATHQLAAFAQTDLVRREHRNRSDEELGHMAFTILRAVIHRLERDGKLSLHLHLTDLYQSWLMEGESAFPITRHLPDPERPPLSP